MDNAILIGKLRLFLQKVYFVKFFAQLMEPQHDKTNKLTCALSEDLDQPGHSPSLIRVFAVHFMGSSSKVSSCGQ